MRTIQCSDGYKPAMIMTLPCNQVTIDERFIFLSGLSKDAEGNDLMTYVCPKCGEIHTSPFEWVNQ